VAAMRSRGVTDGLTAYGRLRGPERAEGMRCAIDSGGVGSAMTALAMEFVFGRVWSRNGLDPRLRSLVTIGILIKESN
jgi:4-carboxymuconolactone decarboxylase